jgi:hypothetical protein
VRAREDDVGGWAGRSGSRRGSVSLHGPYRKQEIYRNSPRNRAWNEWWNDCCILLTAANAASFER